MRLASSSERLERIKNKYDFYFGEGNPATDSIADEDTTWLIMRVEKLTAIAKKITSCCIECTRCAACDFKKALED